MGQNPINIPKPKEFSPYKPKPPNINWGDKEKPFLPFIGEKSWFFFHLLKFNRPQERLNIPSDHWNKFEEFNVRKKFLCNLSCVNDVVGRGIKLIADIKDKCFHPVKREQLTQVAEKHQNRFKEAYHSKKSIKRIFKKT